MPQSHSPKTKLVALRVPVEQITELRETAKANSRTVSGEIRLAIDRHLAAPQKPPPALRKVA